MDSLLTFLAPGGGALRLRTHKRTFRNKSAICALADGPPHKEVREGPTLQFLLGASGAFTRLQRESNELAQAGLTLALNALGVGDEGDEDVNVPTEPRFDPVTAQVLAGYAFRAYEDPSPACYREVHETSVRGSTLSGRQRQVVVAYYAFPDVDVIASAAKGLFQVTIRQQEEEEDKEKEEKGIGEMYVVCRINAGVRLNVIQENRFSLIRKRDNIGVEAESAEAEPARGDYLELCAYENEKAYQEGRPPLLLGSVDLTEVVEMADRTKSPAESGTLEVLMKAVNAEQVGRNFFGISLLPDNVRIPFQRFEQLADRLLSSNPVEEAAVLVEVTYVPFDMAPPEEIYGEEESLEGNTEDDEKSENIYGEGSALQEALREKLPPGQLPLPSNWATLAKGVRELAEDIEPEGRPTVRENIPQSLFVESLSTDTEAWLFHDEDAKDLVISFRGTEEVSWQDFYTDAQMFLQKWEPGGEIDLNLRADVTVGLSTLLSVASSVASSVVVGETPLFEESTVGEEDSCVHYGFLRAYHAVRDAVLHAIDILVGAEASEYRFYFVGHSLGGALATLCACDFVLKNPKLEANVTCVSYGAPKAGNVAFAKLYNASVRNSFRIVNDADLVVRMPRSIGNRACERYRHVGRTVLVNEAGEIWVEGEDMEGGHAIDPFRDRFSDMNVLLEYEQELWSQLVSGRSLRHHMEDSYFLAMTEVLRRSTIQ